MSAAYTVSRFVPNIRAPRCSHTKLYADTDFRYVVDDSESTKPGLLLFHGMGYWFLQCRWGSEVSYLPTQRHPGFSVGQMTLFYRVLFKGVLLLHIARTEENYSQNIFREPLQSCVAGWPPSYVNPVFSSVGVPLWEQVVSWDLHPPCLTQRGPGGHSPWVTGELGFGQVNIKHTGLLQDGGCFNLTFMFQLLCLVVTSKLSSGMCSHRVSATRRNLQRTLITSLKHLAC